jgi:hypothetical protein
MTKVPRDREDGRCGWCRRPLPPQDAGRPRIYCGQSHRQRAYEARRAGARLALRTGQAVVETAALERLEDLLYLLETALEDVAADLVVDPDGHAAALDHLLAAARQLRGVRVDPQALA